jgi:hypothetical protein
MAIWDEEKKDYFCECGCGGIINSWNSYVTGHYPRTPEVIAKQSEAMSGRILSYDRCKQISESLEGHVVTQYTRELISKGNLGKIRSLETCRRISEARKGSTLTPEQCDSLSKAVQEAFDNDP